MMKLPVGYYRIKMMQFVRDPLRSACSRVVMAKSLVISFQISSQVIDVIDLVFLQMAAAMMASFIL